MRIFSKLFGTRKEAPSEDKISPVDVVADFLTTLQSVQPPPSGMVIDEKELPYPKEDIKRCILATLVSISDVDAQKSLFEAYFSLACWRPNVGPERVEIDFSATSSEETQQNIVSRVEPFMKSYEKWRLWESIVDREQKELLEDLG